MSDDVRAPTSSPRGVHIVDATQGPLIGSGRLLRVMPFAATAALGLVVALPGLTWDRPALAIAGLVVVAVTILGSLFLPWRLVPRWAQLASPFLFLAATLMLVSATGAGIGSPLLLLASLPLIWLAIYENRAAVLFAALVAGVSLWIAVPDNDDEEAAHGTATTAVFLVCAAGMGATLHGLVADARRMAHTLRDRQHALEDAATMLNSLPERVNRYRVSDHVITYCNDAWAAQYHVEASKAVGRCLDEFLSEDEMDGLHSQLSLLGPERPVLVDSVARAVPDAPGQWLQWVDRYLEGPDGPEVLSVGRDVTERHDAEQRLADSEARFRDLADKSADVVWRFMLEPSPHFDYMSPSVENILGYSASYFLEDFSRLLDIVDDAGKAAIDRAVRGAEVLGQFDFRFRHANGSIVIGETRTTPIRGGLQGVSRDVTELRQLQDSLASLALHDPLTGLANRRLFNELLDADLARTERSGRPLAVAFIDLDAFKNINDTYGHDVGDLVLCETARRLRAVTRAADTVARIGGDEFVIVFEPDDSDSRGLITRIDRALAAPIIVSPTTEVTCPASIGTADTRAVGFNADALLAAADDAMYAVKRDRKAAHLAQAEPQ